jgi:adenosylcobinamide kinase / adenosylcobinamide-phosphate guanylyltransferase
LEKSAAVSRIVFITGGCRSGKSDFAVQYAAQKAARVAMLVTCVPSDEEMESRVAKHRASRPAGWPVHEAPFDICPALESIAEDVVVFDCLPTWIANRLVRADSPESIEAGVIELLECLRALPSKTVVVVSAEVGMSVVPETLLGRQFRDLVGFANQRFATISSEAYFLVSGLPLELKHLSRKVRSGDQP